MALQVERKYPRDTGCSVPVVVEQKKLLFSTLGSQVTNDFVWKSKAENPLIHLKFCQASLSHNLICKD